jgi:hypothetical protein
MTSKKYILLAGLSCLFASAGFAQQTTTHGTRAIYGVGHDVTDSSLIANKRLAQQSQFLAGTYDYPAKPRDMWELGVKGGSFTVIGDMAADPLRSWGFGAHIRKSLGHVMSLRLEYVYGVARGEGYRPTDQGIIAGIPREGWYPNHKTQAQDLSLQALFNLHNIRFYKAQTAMTFYGLAGVGVNTWRAFRNTTDQPSTAWNGNNKRDVLKSYRDALKGHDYNQALGNAGTSDKWSSTFAGFVKPSLTAGVGIAFKLSDRVNLALEDRAIFVGSDLVDGILPNTYGNQAKDWYNYGTIGLNFNLGNKAKRVQPLYWVNPLNYAYSEIRNPRLMNIPPPVLPDSDGDGVTDQFDLEQTPAGCPVDTHGVSLDTDGDGVPDCKDKEKVTPTYCQPVDADGVGKCPCPEGCGAVASECATLLGPLPSVSFAPNSNTLSSDAKAVLSTVASKMRANPTCKVVVVGYCAATKRQQQLSWDHVNKVITHLNEQEGISLDRFIFSSGQEGGDCNSVDLRAAAPGEEGPNQVAPPHPNLRKK